MKTVTEIRRSSARDTVIAERVYLVLNSLLDWKPVEILKQRCDMGSFTCTCVCLFFSFFFSPVFFQYEASRTVLYATMALDRGSRRAREDNGSSQSVTE